MYSIFYINTHADQCPVKKSSASGKANPDFCMEHADSTVGRLVVLEAMAIPMYPILLLLFQQHCAAQENACCVPNNNYII